MDYSNRIFDFENIYENELLDLRVGGIYQVAELAVIRNGEIARHIQRHDEITYVVSGSAKIVSGENVFDVKAGQIHFIRSGLSHEIHVSDEGNFRYICIAFIPNMDNPSVRALYDECGGVESFVIDDNGSVKTLAEFLIREFYNYDNYSNMMIDQYISQILTTMGRILSDKDYVHNIKHNIKNKNYAMYRMIRYIDREYLRIKSIKDISSHLSYSEYYLSHLFKEKMGITIKEYLNKKKISYAAQMLHSSELTVEQIAEHLGFPSAFSFRRIFKKHVGVTPSEYKKNTVM